MALMTKTRMKLYLYQAMQILLRPVCLIPIKKNRIIFLSHRGGSQYSDSPKYISEYLENNYPNEYQLVWIFNEPEKFKYLASRITIIKRHSFKEFYYLNTSKVCITNCGFSPYLLKRKGQLRINTLHGGGAYKTNIRLEYDTVTATERRYIKLRNGDFYNLMLSSCQMATEHNIRGDFQYIGEVLKEGLPRNDCLINGDTEIPQKVRHYYGLSNEKILLVAPTWRRSDRSLNVELDYSALAELLENKYGGTWKILLRLHHLSKVDISDYLKEHKAVLMDATSYPDAQELLMTADILITDFSSILWDFAIQEKPILLYAPDLKKYEEDRGFNVPVRNWGLYLAESQTELFDIISEHPMRDLENASKTHLKIFGSYESGKATERVCEYIRQFG